ncbi:uncharacterized protein LOC130653764 [Hydractinia symbiolongicarpus]|uniref:uncharacterized protein LOC130653764 n=1 Tax=Hydractinia symbiolongicarpus TaxID=13093 RepID=UPI00254F1C46|nr:uncharacterized protein LOC130653764 [Hydractinia symbiolongicarpus]
MRGCEYTATMSLLSYTFWLINGTNKVNGTVEESTNKNLNNSFSFPKLIMDRFVPSTYYQCGIHYPDRMSKQLLSEKVYTDIDVRFVEGPKLVNTQLHGCSYNSSIPLNAYLYWLVNGTIKEKGTHSISSISTQSESNEYKFSQLDIINHSPGSFYQCVIFYPSRMAHMIVSERIYPDIQDINPIFINQPSLNGTILQGCDYKANISLHKYAYWLINGTKKVNGISVNETSFSEVHDFPDLQILHYDATNFYQCVLYYPNRMKKIVKSLVITPDIRDINPTFITQPYLNGSILSGCSYKSDISLHEYTFWLINDSEVFQTTTSDPMSTTEKDLYNFPEYVIREFKPNTFYQCGVYYSKRMKGIELSDKIYTGNYYNQLITTNAFYINQYLDSRYEKENLIEKITI